MRAIITGQVGVDKTPLLEAVRRRAADKGIDLVVCHVGQMMYAEAPDVPSGRILNLPINRLGALRRAVFKEILRTAERHEHVLVNTHATFRWKHGLFAAFDFDQMKTLAADLFVTLLDNVENVHQRLLAEHEIDHSLKDIMVWREEEVLATEIIANTTGGFGRYYMLSRGGRSGKTSPSAAPPSAPIVQTLYRLLFERHRRKAYLSFPITHVMDLPQTLAEIEQFKSALQAHFICFDPADVEEFALHMSAVEAMRTGQPTIEVPAAAGPITLKTADVAQISSDILGQIYARDFKMIDQSDMIVSLVPELPGGKPALSSGVERELQHAFETGKEVYVIWQCKSTPSPFITETATKVLPDIASAIRHFQKKKLIPAGEEEA